MPLLSLLRNAPSVNVTYPLDKVQAQTGAFADAFVEQLWLYVWIYAFAVIYVD